MNYAVSHEHSILPTLASGQMLIVESDSERAAGLILNGPFMAELVLMGSIVGGPIDARTSPKLFPVGSLKFGFPETLEQRQTAYHKRLQDRKWQQDLVSVLNPMERATRLWLTLQMLFDPQDLASLPDGLLGRIAAVQPGTMATARHASPPESRSKAFTSPPTQLLRI